LALHLQRLRPAPRSQRRTQRAHGCAWHAQLRRVSRLCVPPRVAELEPNHPAHTGVDLTRCEEDGVPGELAELGSMPSLRSLSLPSSCVQSARWRTLSPNP
jgi:hypothetical protein